MAVTAEEAATATTTIVTRLRDWAERTPDHVALRHKDFGVWKEVTWRRYWECVQDCAHALLALGTEPGDRVAIHSENRPEWLYADLATVSVRAMTMGLYPTNPTAEVRYLLDNSGSKVLIAEDQEQVDKALEVADELPMLEKIVYLEPRGIRGRYHDPRLMAWEDFLDLGRAHREAHPDAMARRMAEAGPDDVMTLIYTSGTTGPPKGAMLTVANVEFSMKVLIAEGGFCEPPPTPSDVMLSYLPLCHVAERIFTTWANLVGGHQVHFAESIETVPQNLREVQPTIFFAVPRIWEKLHAGAQIRLASATPLKRLNAQLWLRLADWISDRLVSTGGSHTPATRVAYAVGWLFLFRSLRRHLGLRECRYAASGAAPIAPEVLKWFMGIGVPMHELYGMTENVAVATANRPGRIKLGTVGEPYDGIELRIDEQTGEILTRHPAVFAGYWRNEEATRRAIEPDGWLHTGDVGEWVGDGGGGEGRRGGRAAGWSHLRITDRIKDIIITAGGKNIAPSEIENALKASPFIKEAIVIGDRRHYLSALIGIELDTVGEWAQRRHIPYTTYRDLSEKPEVIELVQGVIDQVNQRFSRVEGVKTFRMLPKELDHEDGELTATQKVKRAVIAKMFADTVEEMYRGRGSAGEAGRAAAGGGRGSG
jgi:long-chain acyl-CoA synthetase